MILRTEIFSLALTVSLWLWSSANHAQEPLRPNVLLIMIDDQNDWIGCMNGHPLAKTPNIDSLAQRGTLFFNAHCQAPLCNPSRISMLSGLRPGSTGIYGLMPQHWQVESLRDVVTMPQALKQAGYQTAAVGKIYHGVPREEELKQREFDSWGPNFGVGIKPQKN